MSRGRSKPSPSNKPKNTGLSYTPVTAKTPNQKKILSSNKNQIIHGYAGTGKSFLGCAMAIARLKQMPKIKIIRSAVSTRDVGHLPGSYEEKIAVYERPYARIFNKLYNCGTAYESLKLSGVVEFETTSYLRGEDYDDMSVIVDECQNMTEHELDSIITRAGDNLNFYFCGDILQSDLKFNGFGEFIKTLKKIPEYYDFTELTEDDIVRGAMMKQYIIAKMGKS